jgi:invasion protein IalB
MPAALCLIPLLTGGLAPAVAQSTPPAHHPAKPHAGPAAAAPKSIGTFNDWQAAIHQEGNQNVCYAFARASAPAKPDIVLTVAERPSGRDEVAITAGFSFAVNAAVTVNVDQTTLEFYTSQRSAFARDGHAAIAAFLKGRQAVAHEPGPHNTSVTDSFSLKGFDQAYAAIVKACPAK